jgi:hypothetical protein
MMNSMRLMLITIFILLTLAGPIYLIAFGKVSFTGDYRTANRDSAHLAPPASSTPEAVIQIYKARAFNWNGLFASHTWIAIKAAHASKYTVYQVIGWRKFRGLSPLLVEENIPDRNWFAAVPTVLMDIRGAQAEQLIPQIEAAVQSYPYPAEYRLWPGPNSNTFTAYVLRQVPALRVELPSNAVGKDFFPDGKFFAPAVSHTGYEISLWGIFSLTLAKEEGLEINLLGLVYGINPMHLSIKLPCIGEISLLKHRTSGGISNSPLS